MLAGASPQTALEEPTTLPKTLAGFDSFFKGTS